MSRISVTRREFLGAAAAAPLAQGKGRALPTRPLGKTGFQTSILAIGCGSRLQMYETQDKGVEALDLALRSGINYIDTAQSYNSGKSEIWVGEAVKGRREGLFVATKTQARTADDAMRRAEESLERLGIDRMDLLHLHSLGGPEDLAKVEKEKVMEALYKLRDRKITRFIGITSHTNPAVLAEALRRYDVDCTQMALNAALQGMRSGGGKMRINPEMPGSFEKVALPIAVEKGLGIVAMKVFGQEDIIGPDSPPEKLLRYSLSLPVSVCTVGVPKHEHLRANVAAAQSFQPMDSSSMEEFSRKTSGRYKLALDRRFRAHRDV